MYFLFLFTREFIEEEGNTRKEHHNTVENGIEEKHHNFCFQALSRVGTDSFKWSDFAPRMARVLQRFLKL